MAKVSTEKSFFIAGDCTDSAYQNVRDNPNSNPDLTEAKSFVESLWTRYKNLNVADRNFLQGAKKHFHARFWEMYLAVTLSEQGFELNKDRSAGPEFYFLHNGRKVWVEAVAPGPGEGDDRVPGHSYGKIEEGLKAESTPEEKILLRFTNALDSKKRKYSTALEKEIIAPDDLYILAVNSRGIPDGWDGDLLPYFVKAFLPLGTPEIQVDLDTGKIIDNFYQIREVITKASGEPIPTKAGLDPEFSFISAVLHSGVDCVNHTAILGEDFSMLHWPAAPPSHRLDPSVFSWCKQIFYKDGTIEVRPKLASQN